MKVGNGKFLALRGKMTAIGMTPADLADAMVFLLDFCTDWDAIDRIFSFTGHVARPSMLST